MKKLLMALALSTSMLGVAPVFAEEAAPAAVVAETVTEAVAVEQVAAPVAEAVAVAEAAPVAAPVPDKGDTTWMLVATVLVIFMSVSYTHLTLPTICSV